MRGGFLGALTLILSAEACALAFGLWSAPRDTALPWSGMRRAWFLLLLSLVAAALVAASWEGLGGLSSTWLARGLGLACLAALPMYATGAVLGATALSDGKSAVPAGPAAAAGAAVGFALIGMGRGVLEVAALAYVAGVVLVSVGALVHSRLLEERDRTWRDWAERGTAHAEIEIAAQLPPPPRRYPIPAPPPPRG